MKPDREQVLRWLAGFQAAEEFERELLTQEGPRPAWSIATALSLIDAVEQMHGAPLVDPLREEREEAVRETWARLRRRLAA